MNKQIKLLLEQSGLQPYYDAQEGQIEKFAELIVRECAAKAWWAEQYNMGNGVPISKQIEQHFGVEE